jgi:hypothetical protein
MINLTDFFEGLDKPNNIDTTTKTIKYPNKCIGKNTQIIKKIQLNNLIEGFIL